MEIKRHSIPVSTSIGNVTGEAVIPSDMKAIVTLAHGAGAGMDHRFMTALSAALAEQGIGTLRFNFPFTEQARKRPDPPAIAEKTVAAALSFAHDLFADMPLYASGKSFGGRMTSQHVSKTHPEFVRGLVFFGFPLHAAGDPSIGRAAHLSDVDVPMLFLQGTRDALADKALMTQVSDSLSLAEVIWFDGADHSFKAGKKDNVLELAEAAATWITERETN